MLVHLYLWMVCIYVCVRASVCMRVYARLRRRRRRRAQDADWATGTLKCETPGHVFLLLKSSDLVGYDLDHACVSASAVHRL
jgi:hypothetical protein